MGAGGTSWEKNDPPVDFLNCPFSLVFLFLLGPDETDRDNHYDSSL